MHGTIKDTRRRSLTGAGLAHFLHDGYTDQLYALLPVWQAEFGLSYAGLAVLRALYYGTMAGLQVPADKALGKLSARTALALSTLVAAVGFRVMGLPFGFASLCAGLVLAGIGSSVQHPRSSLLVTTAYGKTARGPLGIFNFSGDLGKAAFPAIVALLLPLIGWRPVVQIMALVGLLFAIALFFVIPRQAGAPAIEDKAEGEGSDGKGFGLLLTIGACDTATRMGYLLFLPFMIHEKGGAETTVGVGLALLFSGGALGKACCGWLGQRLGVVWSVIATEAGTALLMVLTLAVPLVPTLVILPLLGIVLNGTSSILYGTVPDLARKGEVGKAFAQFYTGVIGAGGLAPIAYGAIADHTSQATGVIASALTAAAIIPMVLALGRFLTRSGERG